MIDILWFGLNTCIEYGHIFTEHFLSLEILLRGCDTRQVPLVHWLVVSVSIPFTIRVYRVHLLSITHAVIPWRVLADDVRRVVANIGGRHFLWAVAV